MLQIPPFQSKAAIHFLASDITALLSAWLSEPAPTSASSAHFPATEVDTAIGKYLMSLSTAGAESTVARLQELQREIRRRF